jgi:asparagine synthase (glutamine-hydrolysing)
MSAIGGVFMFGGDPVDLSLLAALGTRLERLGPDGGREVVSGSVGMSYRAFHINAESRSEHQPHCWGHQAILCWDGRLDNRDELLASLRDDLRGEDTDAAIVMAAYRRWGDRSFGKLLGDFALAIWDKRDHAIWLARDLVGTRTLYYHVDAQRVLWSSDLAALIDTAGMSLEIADEYVASLLAMGAEPGLTPFVGIRPVRPAHVVRIAEDGLVSEHRFWSLDPSKEIRYSSDTEYEDHFRSIFRAAVRDRLRSDRPVFAELSGGLDSSSIVCMAHDIVGARDAHAPSLETVSYVFDDAPTADEKKWIAHVDEWRGFTGHLVYGNTRQYLQPLHETLSGVLPTLAVISPAYPVAVRTIMRQHGGRVLLSGCGGDELLHSVNKPAPELADLAASRNIHRLHARLKVWSRVVRRPYFTLLWNEAICPNLPATLQARLKTGAVAQIPDWLDTGFVTRMRLRERMLEASSTVTACQTPSARIQILGFESALRAVASGTFQEPGGCDYSFPYLDRRLVEFLQAIPFDQKMRPGESRSIMRRALRPILPEAIVRRRGKGNPTEVSFKAMAHEADTFRRMLSDGRVFARGYADPDKFRAAFERAIAGRERHSGRLKMTLVLERWLRAMEHRVAAHATIDTDGMRAPVVTMPPRQHCNV